MSVVPTAPSVLIGAVIWSWPGPSASDLSDQRYRAVFPGSGGARARISCIPASQRPVLRTTGRSQP
jgi:hypothetical protein